MGGAMSSVTISGDTSGSIILQAPAVSGSTTLTLPTTSGTVLTNATTQANLPPNISGNGPAFSAYSSVTTSIPPTVWTKITYDTELFDTNNNFASSRFTPTIAGYYQINGSFSYNGGVTSTNNAFSIWKNGTEWIRGPAGPSSGGSFYMGVSGLVYFNGSTDYIELLAYQQGSSTLTIQTGVISNFNGFLARGA